jgi:hypothetical protein
VERGKEKVIRRTAGECIRPAGLSIFYLRCGIQQVGRTLSLLLSLATLFFTVLAAMALGIAASYWAVSGILFAFGHHSRVSEPSALVESPASGD